MVEHCHLTKLYFYVSANPFTFIAKVAIHHASIHTLDATWNVFTI